METTLSKTSKGQGRLGRAKDRLDIKLAEIGQADHDHENNEQEGNQAPQQENINEIKAENSNDPEGAGGVELIV